MRAGYYSLKGDTSLCGLLIVDADRGAWLCFAVEIQRVDVLTGLDFSPERLAWSAR
jgi:hypothetical protein